ncbi:hypothetical protein JCM10212_006487 [Sporobolomyces blumeae]
MLDHFTILTQGGLVLWSRSFTPSPSPCDALIREALIEQRTSVAASSSSSSVSRWDKDAHSLLWLLDNSLDLVFVAAYQRILSLSYVPDLLELVKRQFLKQYRSTVEAVVDSTKGKDVIRGGEERDEPYRLFGAQGWQGLFKGWDETFNRILKELESNAAKTKRVKEHSRSATELLDSPDDSTPSETPTKATPGDESLDGQTIARNIAALKARQKAAARAKAGRRGTGTGTESESGAGSESDASPSKPKRAAKTATKWADSSLSAADLAAYDYSSDAPSRSDSPVDTSMLVSKDALGKRDKAGMYEVADYSIAPDGDDSEPEDTNAKSQSSSSFSSFFSRLSLSPRALTAADLAPVLASMQSHLTSKNVASPIASQLVTSVGKSLEGKHVQGWGAVKKEVRRAVEDALVKVLTPKTSTDLLLEITRKKQEYASISTTSSTRDPYSITFVGVNGVGKSTNLSKVAFWLLQNHLNVLIAACDTFRSGAVEQLRVHVRNLGRLDEEQGGAGKAGKGKIELFEKGYGKDAAGIAKDAIAHAKQNGFDVVLIDTAGRMQDNEPLMRALAKLISVNQPDKIIFVGEALVGNEAVDQLTKFNRSLRDFSSSGGGGGDKKKEARGIDGMILTKFDTIDDKVGAALSMTYTTGQPIYFVGCGQTYSDLRMLRVGHIVQALLQD